MNFKHTQSAHCESGVTANLLDHQGLSLSEPMVFGIGSGIFFIHLPFVKLNGISATSYRIWPGGIFNRTMKLLGAEVVTKKFSSPEKSMEALDKLLEQNIPVGIMCSVYYLPYLPDAYRFHFNAHNIVIFGKEGDVYLVGDPVLPEVKRLHKDDLLKARYAKGFPQPSGKMYYIKSLPNKEVDLKSAIRNGLKRTSFLINRTPVGFIGAKAIGFLAKRLQNYPKTLGDRKSLLALGNLIRMQEEIGTGGGGFRFMYAAFLKESSKILQNSELADMSKEMTEIGDMWRDFAYNSAKIIKSRSSESNTFVEIGDKLALIGEKEVGFFKRLGKVKII